jgi:osmotically-inducible protein OsmY
MQKPWMATAAIVGVCMIAVGCSQRTINSANEDAQHDISVVGQKADQAARRVKPDLKKLDKGASVTAAITANQNLHGTDIRVDGTATGVRLKGTVNTAAQKSLAAQVAKSTLKPGQTVDNALTIKGD